MLWPNKPEYLPSTNTARVHTFQLCKQLGSCVWSRVIPQKRSAAGMPSARSLSRGGRLRRKHHRETSKWCHEAGAPPGISSIPCSTPHMARDAATHSGSSVPSGLILPLLMQCPALALNRPNKGSLGFGGYTQLLSDAECWLQKNHPARQKLTPQTPRWGQAAAAGKEVHTQVPTQGSLLRLLPSLP